MYNDGTIERSELEHVIKVLLKHKASLEWRTPHDECNRRTALMASILNVY